MKENKKEEAKEIKVEKINTNNKIITNDRVISVVIGIIIGVLITSCAFCICNRLHKSQNIDGPRIQMQDRNKNHVPKRYNKSFRRNHKSFETNSTENNQETDISDNNSNQN